MSAGFLASNIDFEMDSMETKLSSTAMGRLPEPVNWALHDYYSTACEKAFLPIHQGWDLQYLEPVDSDVFTDDDVSLFISDTIQRSLSLRDTPDDAFSVPDASKTTALSVGAATAAAMTSVTLYAPSPFLLCNTQSEICVPLCGALATVDNVVQDNHPFRLSSHAVCQADMSLDDCSWQDIMFQRFCSPQKHKDSIQVSEQSLVDNKSIVPTSRAPSPSQHENSTRATCSAFESNPCLDQLNTSSYSQTENPLSVLAAAASPTLSQGQSLPKPRSWKGRALEQVRKHMVAPFTRQALSLQGSRRAGEQPSKRRHMPAIFAKLLQGASDTRQTS